MTRPQANKTPTPPNPDLPPAEALTPPPEATRADKAPSAIIVAAQAVQESERIVRFRGRGMLETTEGGYRHFVPLHKEMFDPIAYRLLGGLSRSKVADIFAYVIATAEDLTKFDRYIGFGFHPAYLAADPEWRPVVWDTRLLRITEEVRPEDCVWRSPYRPAPEQHEVPFILELAGKDVAVYGDVMQSLSPLIMEAKPDGVMWWVGEGANGKSTLMDAIYRIFPGQLASLTVKRLTDGRDTPGLNGTLANVVKESSEGRIEDTEIYKAIGTHEDFRVHKFHSQDDILVGGNVHHIFSANSIPILNDKGFSARRRTFIVPFTQRFESDPTFEQRTFKAPLFEQTIAEMMRFAVIIRTQGYTYKWSAQARSAKLDYDADANSAEEFGRELIEEGIAGFDSFLPVRIAYENWCGENGYVPLGMNNLRRAMKAVQFERRSIRTAGGGTAKRYLLRDVEASDLVSAGLAREGLFAKPGWRSNRIPEPTPLDADPTPQAQELPLEEDEPKHQIGRKPRTGEDW